LVDPDKKTHDLTGGVDVDLTKYANAVPLKKAEIYARAKVTNLEPRRRIAIKEELISSPKAPAGAPDGKDTVMLSLAPGQSDAPPLEIGVKSGVAGKHTILFYVTDNPTTGLFNLLLEERAYWHIDRGK
jgi:hypothetical protein